MIRVLGLLAATLIAGCSSSLETCDGESSLAGSWQYGGAQETPVHVNLAGTLTIEGGACGTITGELDLIETNGLGHSRRVAGPVTGRIVDATSIRFDALIDGLVRQHIARADGDRMNGTWLALGEGASQALTGTFGGHRGSGQ